VLKVPFSRAIIFANDFIDCHCDDFAGENFRETIDRRRTPKIDSAPPRGEIGSSSCMKCSLEDKRNNNSIVSRLEDVLDGIEGAESDEGSVSRRPNRELRQHSNSNGQTSSSHKKALKKGKNFGNETE
jgi:hypothetical protein